MISNGVLSWTRDQRDQFRYEVQWGKSSSRRSIAPRPFQAIDNLSWAPHGAAGHVLNDVVALPDPDELALFGHRGGAQLFSPADFGKSLVKKSK